MIALRLSITPSTPRGLQHTTAGGYMLHHHTKWCSQDTMIKTFDECSRAKTALEPSAPALKRDNHDSSPPGCFMVRGWAWFFNSHKEGSLDGISEPICKAEAGPPSHSRVQEKRIARLSYALKTYFVL